MIHYLSPFDPQKNIGGSINWAISSILAQHDDWIVLVDQDVMFLRPDSKAQIESILNATDYDLLGCMTNRLGAPYQCVPDMFHQTDILEHIKCANILHKENYGKVQYVRHGLAAMVLCFRVSTWSKLRGFTEGALNFDLLFSEAAMFNKLKLGLMTGVYVFHLYRMNYPEGAAKDNYQHLILNP